MSLLFHSSLGRSDYLVGDISYITCFWLALSFWAFDTEHWQSQISTYDFFEDEPMFADPPQGNVEAPGNCMACKRTENIYIYMYEN